MALKRNLVMLLVLVTLILVGLAFQNCGELQPSALAVQTEASLEVQFRKDQSIIGQVTSSPNLKAWVSARESIFTKAADKITAVASLNQNGFQMTPTLDSPTLANSSAGPIMFSMPGNSVLVTTTPDRISSKTSTLIAVFDMPANGIVARLTLGGGYSETVTIEASQAAGGATALIRAIHYYDQLSYESQVMSVPADGPVVAAASFSDKLGALTLQVNGRVATGDVANQGSPIPATSIVDRELWIGDAAGSAKIGEVMAVATELKPYEMNTMSRYLGDKWGISVFYDASLYPADDVIDPNKLPADVKKIITDRCASCHQHTAWASYSVSDFVGSGDIVKGNPDSSPLYIRLNKGNGVSGQDMPFQLDPLSASDINVLKNWITNLK